MQETARCTWRLFFGNLICQLQAFPSDTDRSFEWHEMKRFRTGTIGPRAFTQAAGLEQWSCCVCWPYWKLVCFFSSILFPAVVCSQILQQVTPGVGRRFVCNTQEMCGSHASFTFWTLTGSSDYWCETRPHETPNLHLGNTTSSICWWKRAGTGKLRRSTQSHRWAWWTSRLWRKREGGYFVQIVCNLILAVKNTRLWSLRFPFCFLQQWHATVRIPSTGCRFLLANLNRVLQLGVDRMLQPTAMRGLSDITWQFRMLMFWAQALIPVLCSPLALFLAMEGTRLSFWTPIEIWLGAFGE